MGCAITPVPSNHMLNSNVQNRPWPILFYFIFFYTATVQKLLPYFHTPPPPSFSPFITVSQPPMILRERVAHDNLIVVCWCRFNAKLLRCYGGGGHRAVKVF